MIAHSDGGQSDSSDPVTVVPGSVVPPPNYDDERWVHYASPGGGPGAGKRILLSPAGHAPGGNFGCVGTGKSEVYRENDGARTIANRAAEILQELGFEVYVSLRDGTTSASDPQGPRGSGAYNSDYAIELGVDLHVPMHSNAVGVAPNFQCDETSSSFGGTFTIWEADEQRSDAEVAAAAMASFGPGTHPVNGTAIHASETAPGTLGELRVTAAAGIRALYIEMAHHTWRPEVDWLLGVQEPAEMVVVGIRSLLG